MHARSGGRTGAGRSSAGIRRGFVEASTLFGLHLSAAVGSPCNMTLPPIWHLFGQDHLPYRLLLLARMIDRRSARELQKFGLSLAEWRVLAFIGVTGPASAAQIGK